MQPSQPASFGTVTVRVVDDVGAHVILLRRALLATTIGLLACIATIGYLAMPTSLTTERRSHGVCWDSQVAMLCTTLKVDSPNDFRSFDFEGPGVTRWDVSVRNGEPVWPSR